MTVGVFTRLLFGERLGLRGLAIGSELKPAAYRGDGEGHGP